MDMIHRIGVTLLLLLGLDSLAKASTSCLNQMKACTEQMKENARSLDNKTTLCGVMDIYFDCIRTSCNTSFTPCDLVQAENAVDTALRDYNIYCETDAPVVKELCNTSSSLPSMFSIVIILSILHTCFILLSRKCQA